jgi:hypothetical protein
VKALPKYDPKSRYWMTGRQLNALQAALRERNILVAADLEKVTTPSGTVLKLRR